MQQKDYIGYDSVERNVTIARLPVSVSKDGLSYTEETPGIAKDEDAATTDNLDLTMLKSAHSTNHKARTMCHGSSRHSSTFHNSYTIYEETSDFSGNESSAQISTCSKPSSDSRDELEGKKS